MWMRRGAIANHAWRGLPDAPLAWQRGFPVILHGLAGALAAPTLSWAQVGSGGFSWARCLAPWHYFAASTRMARAQSPPIPLRKDKGRLSNAPRLSVPARSE